MRINLAQTVHAGCCGPTLMEQMRTSAEVLREYEDTAPVGPPVLVPADQTKYPGAYEVWYPTIDNWVYIDDEGVAHHRVFLPLSDESAGEW